MQLLWNCIVLNLSLHQDCSSCIYTCLPSVFRLSLQLCNPFIWYNLILAPWHETRCLSYWWSLSLAIKKNWNDGIIQLRIIKRVWIATTSWIRATAHGLQQLEHDAE